MTYPEPSKAKHGETKTRLYNIWQHMRRRCFSPANKRYKYYGRRGITVCPEWSDFLTFKAWALANGYAEDLSIDRIDNDADYTPENCRWATQKQQNRNYSRNRIVSWRGKDWTVTDLAEHIGMQPNTLHQRVFKYGMSVEEAVSRPVFGVVYGEIKPWQRLGMSRTDWYRKGKPMAFVSVRKEQKDD